MQIYCFACLTCCLIYLSPFIVHGLSSVKSPYQLYKLSIITFEAKIHVVLGIHCDLRSAPGIPLHYASGCIRLAASWSTCTRSRVRASLAGLEQACFMGLRVLWLEVFGTVPFFDIAVWINFKSSIYNWKIRVIWKGRRIAKLTKGQQNPYQFAILRDCFLWSCEEVSQASTSSAVSSRGTSCAAWLRYRSCIFWRLRFCIQVLQRLASSEDFPSAVLGSSLSSLIWFLSFCCG